MATRLWTGQFSILISPAPRVLSPNSTYRLWGPPSFLFSGYGISFPGVKHPGREVHHSPPSSAEVMSDWSYISASPIELHSMDRHNFPLAGFITEFRHVLYVRRSCVTFCTMLVFYDEA